MQTFDVDVHSIMFYPLSRKNKILKNMFTNLEKVLKNKITRSFMIRNKKLQWEE